MSAFEPHLLISIQLVISNDGQCHNKKKHDIGCQVAIKPARNSGPVVFAGQVASQRHHEFAWLGFHWAMGSAFATIVTQPGFQRAFYIVALTCNCAADQLKQALKSIAPYFFSFLANLISVVAITC